jgi:hypothetical protein
VAEHGSLETPARWWMLHHSEQQLQQQRRRQRHVCLKVRQRCLSHLQVRLRTVASVRQLALVTCMFAHHGQ